MDDVNLTPSQSAGPESSGMTEVGLALHATDFLIAPAWVISGVLLWLGVEVVVIFGLGLVCFVPLALFMCGVSSAARHLPS